MFLNKTFMTSLVIMGLSLPFAARAELSIKNNTDFDSAAIINNGACSNNLPGGAGVTKAHSRNTISSTVINLACFANRKACQAEIFLTPNCKPGSSIGKAVFDTTNGVQAMTITNPAYYAVWTKNTFSVIMCETSKPEQCNP